MAGSAAEFRRLTPENPRLTAPDTARPPVQAASIPPCGARTSVRATGSGRAPPGVRFGGADLPGARGRGPDARAPRPAAPARDPADSRALRAGPPQIPRARHPGTGRAVDSSSAVRSAGHHRGYSSPGVVPAAAGPLAGPPHGYSSPGAAPAAARPPAGRPHGPSSPGVAPATADPRGSSPRRAPGPLDAPRPPRPRPDRRRRRALRTQ